MVRIPGYIMASADEMIEREIKTVRYHAYRENGIKEKT